VAECLPAEGALFINGDSEWAESIAKRAKARVIRVGVGLQNEYRVGEVRLDEMGVSFRLKAPFASLNGDYRIQLLGRHQALKRGAGSGRRR